MNTALYTALVALGSAIALKSFEWLLSHLQSYLANRGPVQVSSHTQLENAMLQRIEQMQEENNTEIDRRREIEKELEATRKELSDEREKRIKAETKAELFAALEKKLLFVDPSNVTVTVLPPPEPPPPKALT